ncbi:MAG: c-type cytochrome [Pirellulaceae bacterium]|nr:c-type cytochrome [Pirellulaceae bacterium]
MRTTLATAVFLTALGLSATLPVHGQQRSVYEQQPEIAPAIEIAADGGQPAETPRPADKPADQVPLEGAPAAEWIWGAGPLAGHDQLYFRTEFEGPAAAARLIASCDNEMTVWINGQQVASSSDWQAPVRVDAGKFVRAGRNELLVRGRNQGGPAGLAVKLGLRRAGGKLDYVVSGKSWEVAAERQATAWTAANSLGRMGTAPWGDVFAAAPQALASRVPRDTFQVLPGYQVELLYNVPKDELGSWVAIAFDDRGRLLASDQGNQGICRITPPPIGSQQPTKVEKLDLKISAAQGMLHAFGSLYLSVNGGPGSGFYRARDTNGDDQYDELKLLKPFQGGGEHGPHAVRLGPDGQSLYVIAGNHTDPPRDFGASRVPRNWGEDLLLPRQWDARGHAAGKLAPGGWIARTDAEGQQWEMFSIGYRNPYDMDFNADGELFAYDADMEWDMGTPWYRPTRVVHATSGSEFGWRSGTGKWPTWYVDSLPQVVDIGPGSPVGVTFGTGARFPERYQRALYLLDWTFGTIYAIHLQPDGASYTGVKEEFLSRTPLPLTDAAVGPDGALYFTVGGRGTDSALYRVTYVGDESTDPVSGKNVEQAELRALRRELESYHTRKDANVIERIWPHLGHADRHIRFAARTALEHQDPAAWQQRALGETDPQRLITALVALARQGDKSLQPAALQALLRLDYKSLTKTQQLELLRTYALLFVRQGQPEPKLAQAVVEQLDPHYPAATDEANRELCQVLVYLNSPTVIGKTLALMAQPRAQSAEDLAELLARNAGYGGTIARMLSNLPEIQNIHYAFALRNMRYGWTLEQRQAYFAWFQQALARSGGASYEGFINNIRTEALANVSPAERQALEAQSAPPPLKLDDLPKAQGPGREWKLDELLAAAESGLSGRNFENGKRMFAAAKCVACHRFDGEGGATGPDLSNVAGRFSLRDLSEALVEPDKVISDQYRATILVTAGGQVLTGRIVSEQDGMLTVQTDAYDATKIARVAKSDVEDQRPSPTSLMPKGLLNTLNRDELLDLLAYLLSRGNPQDALFAGQ